VLGDATWVVVDKKFAAMADTRDVRAHRERVDRLLLDPRSQVVFDKAGVLVIRRNLGR
jgi:DNA-binding transcriptional regulator/RsmH inhibitor MraZ